MECSPAPAETEVDPRSLEPFCSRHRRRRGGRRRKLIEQAVVELAGVVFDGLVRSEIRRSERAVGRRRRQHGQDRAVADPGLAGLAGETARGDDGGSDRDSVGQIVGDVAGCVPMPRPIVEALSRVAYGVDHRAVLGRSARGNARDRHRPDDVEVAVGELADGVGRRERPSDPVLRHAAQFTCSAGRRSSGERPHIALHGPVFVIGIDPPGVRSIVRHTRRRVAARRLISHQTQAAGRAEVHVVVARVRGGIPRQGRGGADAGGPIGGVGHRRLGRRIVGGFGNRSGVEVFDGPRDRGKRSVIALVPSDLRVAVVVLLAGRDIHQNRGHRHRSTPAMIISRGDVQGQQTRRVVARVVVSLQLEPVARPHIEGDIVGIQHPIIPDRQMAVERSAFRFDIHALDIGSSVDKTHEGVGRVGHREQSQRAVVGHLIDVRLPAYGVVAAEIVRAHVAVGVGAVVHA